MPSISTLSINNGATTPVAFSFIPVSTNGSRAEWAERTSSLPTGYQVITDEVRKPVQKGGAYRRLVGFNFPTIGTVDGQSVIVRNGSAQVIFNFSETSTDTERKDQLAFVTNFLSNAAVKAAVPALEPFY